MQTVSEVMTRDVRYVSPGESLQHAAQMMGELDVGVLPVCDGDRLIGMVTDRDITIRSTAAGRSPQESHVDEVMSTDVRWCFEDQALDEVMIQMADSQIRRVPVVSRDEQHRLLGIVALADVATRTGGDQKKDVEQVVEMVSAPDTGQQGQQQQAGGQAGTDGGTGGGTGAAQGTGGSGAGGEGGFGDEVAAGSQADTATGSGNAADAGKGGDQQAISGNDLTGGNLPPV
jgi:CBS domain-containing protein